MKKTKSGVEEGKGGDSPSQLIDARIEELSDWRGETLARIRMLIKQADPEVVEELKWKKPSNSMAGVPVWCATRRKRHRADVRKAFADVKESGQ